MKAMNKKIYIIVTLLLLTGVFLLHNTSSEISILTNKFQNERCYVETPLFRTRLLQAEQKTTTLFQIHFLHENQMSIVIPPSNQYNISRPNQNSYTSYHTGACIHPTECPCITSGVFCGGKPTCGMYCAFPLVKNEYQKVLT